MLLPVDLALALIHEFGLWIAGAILGVGGLVVVIKTLDSRLRAAYADQIKTLTDSHAAQVKALAEGHQREIEAREAFSKKGWEQSTVWQQQAERLAERYGEATQIAADMSREVFEQRRTRPRAAVR